MQQIDRVVDFPIVMHWLFPTNQNKKRSLSPSESFAKNQIACSARIVLCELRLGSKPRSMSSLPHDLLFSFTFFFFLVTYFLKEFFLFLNIFFPSHFFC